MTALPYWQPRQFAGIGRRDALWNAILTHAGSDIALGSGARAVFAPGAPPGDEALCTRLRLHDGRLGDGELGDAALTLHVVWRGFPFAPMFGADITTEDLAALPPALRDALIRGMIDVLAGALWPQGFSDTRPGRPERASIMANAALGDLAGGVAEDTSWFDVTIDGFADGSAAIGVGVSRAALLASAENRAILPARVFEEARALITIPATFTLGSASFPARELARIDEGTVILLPRSPHERRMLRVDKTILEFHATGGAWILAGRQQRAPRPDRHRFRKRDVTDQTRAEDADHPADHPTATNPTASDPAEPPARAVAAGGDPATPSEADPASPAVAAERRQEDRTPDSREAGAEWEADAPPAPEPTSGAEVGPGIAWENEGAPVPAGIRIADLGITVDFDIGEKDFTLAEIETWQAGAVVTLEPPPLAGRVEVTLRVNGQAIATGDLIAIDDRLAVRLSRLLLRDS